MNAQAGLHERFLVTPLNTLRYPVEYVLLTVVYVRLLSSKKKMRDPESSFRATHHSYDRGYLKKRGVKSGGNR